MEALAAVGMGVAAAVVTALLAGLVALKDRRSFPNRCFIALLLLLAVVELLRVTPWQQAGLGFQALLPGTGLLFSLSFARASYGMDLRRWKFVAAAMYAAPLLAFPWIAEPVDAPLGAAGKTFYAIVLVSATLMLANLERTLRASTGRIRWQIKFIVLGLSAICAVWIYISSQALIYSVVDPSLAVINPAVLLGADALFLWGLARSRFLHVDVYLSRTTLQYSLTAFLVSAYLVSVGVLAYLVRFLGLERPLPLDALLVLLALAGLAVLLLSDRLQERLKRVVTRHFRRPLYDYRKEWMTLTERTNSLVDVHELCTAVAKIMSQVFGILSVNIWLCNEAKGRLALAGSTVFTRPQAQALERSGAAVSELLRAAERNGGLLDFAEKSFDWAEDIMRSEPEYFRDFRMRYVVPMQTGGQLVGVFSLNGDRVGKAPLSMEDQDLLHAYGAHLAARVLQLRLSEKLRHAQEMEAFQSASTFFVHDMKNLASRLSLTMQNLPVYFDNPEFRADALKLIGESLGKIESTCERLSSLRQKLEVRPVETDFNELVAKTLEGLCPGMKVPLERDLQPLPPVRVDPEQMTKVLTNLVLNAHEAVNGTGRIRVATSVRDGQVVLSVADNGAGMSKEFVEQSLFRPFRSTKKRGMGIGLFHSKVIVEAHHGRIEVASEERKGTTFRVVLNLEGSKGSKNL